MVTLRQTIRKLSDGRKAVGAGSAVVCEALEAYHMQTGNASSCSNNGRQSAGILVSKVSNQSNEL